MLPSSVVTPKVAHMFSANWVYELKFQVYLVQFIVGLAVAAIIAPGVVYNWWHEDWLNREISPGKTLKAEMERMAFGEVISAAESKVSMPVMLWWTPFSATRGRKKCGKAECLFVKDKKYAEHPMTKAVFFYGSDFDPYDDLPLPKSIDQSWALLHEESPKNSMHFNHAALMNVFNHTSTFRRSSDLPLTLQYLETNATFTSKKFLVSIAEKNRLRREEGLAPVAFVQSNCDNPSGRDALVKELMKHVDVDSYGDCDNNKEFPTEWLRLPRSKDSDEMKRFIARYKFVVAVENAACTDYVTEKLWRALEVGSVPIYYGAPNVRELLPKRKSAVVVEDFKNVSDLAKFIRKLDGDDDAYLEYLKHKGKKSSNTVLRDLLSSRSWGVSESSQMSQGNFVEHFECLVCEREWFRLHNRFRPVSHRALPDHYGCPAPRNPIPGVDGNIVGWIVEHVVARIESEAVGWMVASGMEYTKKRFAQEVKRCLDNGFSCWKHGLDEVVLDAVAKIKLEDVVMRKISMML